VIKVQITYNPSITLNEIRSANVNLGIKHIALSIVKRKRLNKNLFTDKNHYLLYSKYFKGYPIKIFLSNKYVVVENIIPLHKRKRYCYYCRDNEDKDNDNKVYAYMQIWVLGFDSNNKLFINLIRNNPAEYFSRYITPILELNEDKDIELYFLGYSYNVGDNEIIAIKDRGIYRVQGEIVYNFVHYEYSFLKDIIISKIRNNIDNQINTLVNTYLAFKVRQFLLSLGFSDITIRGVNTPNLEIRINRLYYVKDFDKKINKLKQLLSKLLINDLTEDNGLRIEKEYINSRYRDIVITLYPSYTVQYRRLSDYVKNELDKYLYEIMSNKVKKAYTVYLGNHKIVIESIPLEYSILIPKDLNPTKDIMQENEVIINANIRDNIEFFVLEGFRSEVYHNVHGAGKIEFYNPGLVGLTTTVIDNMHFRYQNHIAFSQL